MSAMRELAQSGALDEISNADDGAGIALAIQRAGVVREGKVGRAVLFVIYQTGRYGPQNGFRLALVKEEVRVEVAREMLKGVVGQGAEEFLVVRPEAVEEDGDTHDGSVVFE